jgi:hypothetical protein
MDLLTAEGLHGRVIFGEAAGTGAAARQAQQRRKHTLHLALRDQTPETRLSDIPSTAVPHRATHRYIKTRLLPERSTDHLGGCAGDKRPSAPFITPSSPYLQGRREVAEAVAALGHVTDAGPEDRR